MVCVRFVFIATISLIFSYGFLTHIEALKQCSKPENCLNLGSCGCELSRIINAEKELTDDQAYELSQNVCELDLNSNFEFKVKVCCECLGKEASTLVPKLDILPPRVSLQLEPSECSNYTHEKIYVLPTECGFSKPYEDLIRPRIIKGNRTVYHKLPWMARLITIHKENNTVKFICGGSIISERYILTAAHCFTEQQPLHVVVGLTDVDEDYKDGQYDYLSDLEAEYPDLVTDVQSIQEKQHFIHPKFNLTGANENDIALIRLERPVKFSISTRPICLPVNEKYCKNLENTELIVSGWGRTSRTEAESSQLLHAEVPFVPNKECVNIFKKSMKIFKNNICAGGGFTDACFGDSGGPLQLMFPHGSESLAVQYGIVSQGLEGWCSKPGYPGIYTSVKHFLTWIIDTIDKNY